MSATQNFDFIKNQFQDEYIFEINGAMFHMTDSYAVFNKEFSETLFEDEHLYLITGTDSGLLPQYIQKHGPARQSRYIFVEADDVIELIREKLCDLKLDPLISIVTFDELDKKLDDEYNNFGAHDMMNYFLRNKAKYIKSIGAMDTFYPAYGPLCADTKKIYSRLNWDAGAATHGKLFGISHITNIAYNHTHAKVLSDFGKNKSAVLLAAGPSLDDHIEWLKENQDNVFVVAVSRTAKRLIDAGIKPHLIMAADPYLIGFTAAKEVLLMREDTVFANLHHVNHQLVASWTGRSLYIGNRFPWLTADESEDLPIFGETISNIAICVLVSMGFKEIYLAGLDLCFSKEGFQYAKGNAENETGPALDFSGYTVTTYGGTVVETSVDYAKEQEHLANQAKWAETQNSTLYNVSSQSAKIKGIDFKPMDSFPTDQWEKTPRETLYDTMPAFDKEERLQFYSDMRKECNKAKIILQKQEEIAKRIYNCYSKFIQKDGEVSSRFYAKIEKYKKTLNKNESMKAFIEYYGYAYMTDIYKPYNKAEECLEELEQEKCKVYYLAYRASVQDILNLVKATLKSLDMLAMEEKSDPDFDILATYWKENYTTGRVILWKERFPKEYDALPEERKEELKKLEERHYSMIDTLHLEQNKEQATKTHAKSVIHKLRTFYQNKDVQGLENMIQGLSMSNLEKHQDLLNLAKATVFELKNDYDNAITSYYHATNNEDTIEFSLTRLASLLLTKNDGGNALHALEALSQLSPMYLPQYAHLCKLLGKYQDSLAAYLDYIEIKPEDLNALMKVGMLYKEMNLEDDAKGMFSQILEKFPNHDAAKKMLEG